MSLIDYAGTKDQLPNGEERQIEMPCYIFFLHVSGKVTAKQGLKILQK